ncbi:major capsid protein E [Microcystis phage Mae-JY30]
MLDIFNSDAFSVTSLTDALRDRKPRPSRLRDLGLFRTSSVATLSVGIERVGDMLQLVTPTPRGSPGETRESPKRTIENITIPHFQRDWSVYADEVQGVRAFGSETALMTVQNLVAQKIDEQLSDLDLTDEYSKIGAIQGIVNYKGGSSLNLFTKFDVSQPSEIDFDLDAASPTDGILRKACTDVIRAMRRAVGGLNFGSVHAFCGDNFFDDLLRHKEVRDTYKGWSDAVILRDSYVGSNRGSNPIFEFGGILWENYGAIEQSGDGALMGIHTDKVQFIPLGLDGLFRRYLAPADYEETVNTLGLEQYARQWPMQNGKGRHGEVQRNVLHICTRPNVLLRGRRT